MKKKLIFEAIAFLDHYETSPSISSTGKMTDIQEVYVKNAIVSLLTIKKLNLDSDVALVINFALKDTCKKLLEEHDIIIFHCNYNYFRMPPQIVYSLSYYKLCAFDYILNNTAYEKVCFADCDTIGIGNFEKVWKEAEDSLLMIPYDVSIDSKIRKEINGINRLLQGKGEIAHFYSYFIAGKRDVLEIILNECHRIYEQILEKIKKLPEGGDEVIWSLALSRYKGKVYSPKAYILQANIGAREYWIDKPNFQDKDIVLWHLPAEKRYAMIWVYKFFVKYGQFPTVEKMAKVCRFRHIKNRFTFDSIVAILQDKTVLKRNVIKIFKIKRKCK